MSWLSKYKKLIAIVLVAPFLIVGFKAGKAMYKYAIFMKIAHELTVGMDKDYDKTINISQHIFSKIKPSFKPGVMPAIDDNFLNIYTRGFGYCDQSSYACVMMLSCVGIKASMVFLKNERGISPHTIVVAENERGKIVIDTTFYRIIPYGQIDKEEDYPYPKKWFDNGNYWDIGRKLREVSQKIRRKI
jgi:hypothetical protein